MAKEVKRVLHDVVCNGTEDQAKQSGAQEIGENHDGDRITIEEKIS